MVGRGYFGHAHNLYALHIFMKTINFKSYFFPYVHLNLAGFAALNGLCCPRSWLYSLNPIHSPVHKAMLTLWLSRVCIFVVAPCTHGVKRRRRRKGGGGSF